MRGGKTRETHIAVKELKFSPDFLTYAVVFGQIYSCNAVILADGFTRQI